MLEIFLNIFFLNFILRIVVLACLSSKTIYCSESVIVRDVPNENFSQYNKNTRKVPLLTSWDFSKYRVSWLCPWSQSEELGTLRRPYVANQPVSKEIARFAY